MGENKGGCFSVTIVVCIFLIVGLDVIAGLVAIQAEVAQEEVHIYVSHIYIYIYIYIYIPL